MPPAIKQSRFPISDIERRLIEGCLKQDRRAQKELYDRYKDAMFTLSYRITGDKELAGDVLQEAFLGVFRGMHQFRFESTLGAWIKTILVRTAYKKLRKQPQMEMLDERHIGEQIAWGDFLNAEYLEKAIQSLPDGYRSVFVLIEVEGYTHKEVAEMLGISVGTSKSQLFYAKKKLQKKLKALGVR
jgi:RNA polymerase sigma factor (sigma-70 family)